MAALQSNLDILKDVEKAVCEEWPSKDIESLSQKCRPDILKEINAIRGGSRILGDYSSNLLGSEPRPSCLRDTPTIWANDKPCVFIVASYS